LGAFLSFRGSARVWLRPSGAPLPCRPAERRLPRRLGAWLSAALALLPEPAGELLVGPVCGDPEPDHELLAVLFGQQAVQRGQEDRPVRPPQRAGDDAGHEIVVGRA